MKKQILTQPKILTLDGVSKLIARDATRLHLFKDISLEIRLGQKIGLLGVNGAGKSTLMKVIAGREQDFDGKIIKHVENIPWGLSDSGDFLRIGYLEQEPNLNSDHNIFEAVMEGMQFITALQKRYEQVIEEMCDPLCDMNALMQEQDYIENRLDFLNGWNIDESVVEACRALKCPDDLQRKIGTLSGGEKRRVALAKLLLSRPDILLLDEPTNHLDITSVEWLEKFVNAFRGVVMTVTHDRVFLEATSNTVMELDQSKLFTHYGLYTEWLRKRAGIAFTEDKTQEKLKKTIEREHAMLTKGQKIKGRINKIKELEKQLETSDVIPFIGYEPSLLIPQGVALKSRFILNVEDLTYVHPESGRCFFKKLTFALRAGMVVGIVGPNGIGKTTLFKLMVGKLAPTSGAVHIANGVQLGYIDQTRQELEGQNMVWQEILRGHDMNKPIIINEKKQMGPREYVTQFNFSGKSQEKLIGFLSGGERNRVHLAKSLRDGCNVLLLDEPSNDLDVDTVRKLEECMETFRGAAMVISHDRYFLDRVCTHLIAFESVVNNGVHETKVQWFEGNYSEYLAFKAQQKKKAKQQKKEARVNGVNGVNGTHDINDTTTDMNGVAHEEDDEQRQYEVEADENVDDEETIHAVIVERQAKHMVSD
eukprot:CAMPEP_0197036264 /NCGR_PEP_ID=MMETSP1384-20130603/13826_1 /TAXON_ID=29189 /ORGANISM="Ammonia sp." /LENGTH=648 /DNA_ID=CAMNT_0042466425 /DNA_START=173 /DNA_END=2116 /DNA_ORIENTATION=+